MRRTSIASLSILLSALAACGGGGGTGGNAAPTSEVGTPASTSTTAPTTTGASSDAAAQVSVDDATSTAAATDAAAAPAAAASALVVSTGANIQAAKAQVFTYVPGSQSAQQIAAANASAWPFVQPSLTSLRASSKKVFAHYLVPYPVSIDNRDPPIDYYTTQYMSPNGEGGRHAASGGYIKERPMPRAIIPGVGWSATDMAEDVKRAAAAGLDGFSLDILATTGDNWTRTLQMMSTAQSTDSGFKILLMPDMEAEFKTAPQNMVPAIIALSAYPSAYRLADGRLVLAPYNAQEQSVAWWQKQIAALAAAGVNVAFFPTFQSWQTYAPTYAPISYGMSDWGSRSPGGNVGNLGVPAKAHTYNTLWMSPAAPQDSRPKSLIYWESGGSANYRVMWENAIKGGADWVQAITWNDYSEATEISPSSGTQWSFYDLTAYYTTWFKTGKQPTVTKDVLYYFHRVQAANSARNVAKQPTPYALGPGSDPAADQVELLAFLTTPGTVQITSGTQTYSFAAPAGMSSYKVPLASGNPTVRLLRNNLLVVGVKSSFGVNSMVTYQDFLYRSGSTSRAVVSPH